MKPKKPTEPTEPTKPKKETYVGTRPYSSLSDGEKEALHVCTMVLVDWIWEHREEIEKKIQERKDAGWTPPPGPTPLFKNPE